MQTNTSIANLVRRIHGDITDSDELSPWLASDMNLIQTVLENLASLDISF